MRTVAGALAMAATIGLTAGWALAEDVAGTWVMDDGEITVRLAPCGDNLCGKIVAMKEPLDKKGRPKRDKKNPDSSLRDRPVMGLMIMANMKDDGDKSWAGKIYNPDDGNTYASYMTLGDDGQMKVKGCVLILCKKMKFNRVE